MSIGLDSIFVSQAAAPERSTQRFRTISADVTRPAENQRVMDEVKAWNHGHPPDIVWAIAGAAQPSLFLDASIEQLQSQMDVNYWSAAYLAQVTLREWLLPQRHSSSSSTNGENPAPRHFIMTSSTAAFVGVGGFAPYSPTKAAIRSLHDQLRSELNLYHGALAVKQAGNSDSNAQCVPEVKIHTVFPGTILTPGLEVENKSKHPITKLLEEDDEAQTDVQVAMAAVAELGKGRSLITTQNFQGAAMKATSLMGSPRDRWFVDTIFTWVMAVVWLFVSWDMERKVWKWGKEHGMPQHSRDK